MFAAGDATGARHEQAEAEQLEASAAAFLDHGTHVTGPQAIGNGGELVVATQEAMENVPGIIETLRQSPDMLNALVSRERLELAVLAGGGSTDVLDPCRRYGANYRRPQFTGKDARSPISYRPRAGDEV
jgi:hypothetical protein